MPLLMKRLDNVCKTVSLSIEIVLVDDGNTDNTAYLSNGLIYVTVPAFQKLWSHHEVVNQHFSRYVMSGVENLFKHLQGKKIFKTYFNSLLFIPIYCFRVLSNISGSSNRRKGAASDFSALSKASFIDKILYYIFLVELYLLRRITCPFGVSALFLWKKCER
jgi:hypothetical protein